MGDDAAALPVQNNESEWVGMPEFVQDTNEPYQKIIMRFRNATDVADFSKAIGQPITPQTKFLWYPAQVRGENSLLRYVDEE